LYFHEEILTLPFYHYIAIASIELGQQTFFVNLRVANPILQTFIANGGGKNTPQHISAAIQDRDKISTATPPFS